MIFVCGIHGVGKTFYCKKLEKEYGKRIFSASDLIVSKRFQEFKEKRVSGISENQNILIAQVNKLKREFGDFILDGHLCLLDKNGKIEKLPVGVFKSLNIKEMIVLVESPNVIQRRLKARDGVNWDINFIDIFQNKEVEYAYKVAKEVGADLKIISDINNEDYENKRFDKNIILPIKPIYAEEILSNRKKYEFRKKLCVANINKIYLYATAPYMCIIGEVEVRAKLVMEKNRLWNIVKDSAGISFKYYEEYFKKTLTGSAYYLGECCRYDEKILLRDIGINYTPQSFVYVNELEDMMI